MSWGVSTPNNQNYIINGDFNIWQRGTSFPASGWTADRWKREIGSSTSTTSRQSFTIGQTDVPGEPQYYLSSLTNSTGTPYMYQSVEGVRTLAGQVVTVSFYAWADANRTITVELLQYFGTGGSAPVAFPTTVNLTTAKTKFVVNFTLDSIFGKTIGTLGDDCLTLIFAGPATTSCTLNYSQVKLEAGAVATPFISLPPEIELALCQRYYEKSFDVNSTPAQNFGRTGALEFPAVIAGTTQSVWPYPFKVQKRAVPTVTWYSPSDLSAQIYNESRGVPCTGTFTVGSTATAGFLVAFNGPASQLIGDTLSVHWTADAELS